MNRIGEGAPRASAGPLLAAVGSRIMQLRKEAGLEIVECARRAGINKGYWVRLEQGSNLSITSLSRISLALGVPMSTILAGIAADPATLGARPYQWAAGVDERPPRAAGRKMRKVDPGPS